MKYLDVHVHFNSTDRNLLDSLAKTARENSTMLLLSGGIGYGEYDMPENDEVIKYCREYADCLRPMAKLTMDKTADPAEVYHYAEKGVCGFKCIYPYYEYDHDVYMPLYEAAEKCNLPILFHTGNYRPNFNDTGYRRPILKNMHPINLDRIARSFQKLNIIMAHMGTRIFQHEASLYTFSHSNWFTDFGGCGQWKRLQAQELTEMFSPGLSCIDVEMKNFRRIVLGSDAYVTHPHIITEAQKYYRILLERVGVPESIIREIFGGTAAKWLNIELEN